MWLLGPVLGLALSYGITKVPSRCSVPLIFLSLYSAKIYAAFVVLDIFSLVVFKTYFPCYIFLIVLVRTLSYQISSSVSVVGWAVQDEVGEVFQLVTTHDTFHSSRRGIFVCL